MASEFLTKGRFGGKGGVREKGNVQEGKSKNEFAVHGSAPPPPILIFTIVTDLFLYLEVVREGFCTCRSHAGVQVAGRWHLVAFNDFVLALGVSSLAVGHELGGLFGCCTLADVGTIAEDEVHCFTP